MSQYRPTERARREREATERQMKRRYRPGCCGWGRRGVHASGPEEGEGRMSNTPTLTRAAHAMGQLSHAFQFGRSVEQPGIITAAHTATWHMAGMIEHLHVLHSDQAKELRRGEETSG